MTFEALNPEDYTKEQLQKVFNEVGAEHNLEVLSNISEANLVGSDYDLPEM